MSESFSFKKYNRATQIKIIAAFILGCGAVLLSLNITRSTFTQVLSTVRQVSQPHPQANLVNNIFRQVVVLDNAQRELTLSGNMRLSRQIVQVSDTLHRMLDLLATEAGDEKRMRQVDSMKKLLQLKNRLFADYISLRTDLIKNDTTLAQVKMLSEHIYNPNFSTDTNVVTVEKKVTTITTERDTSRADERQSFWNRLFGKKKPAEPREIQKMVQEELNIKIDTLAIAGIDSTIQSISEALNNEVVVRISKRNRLINQQLEMASAGNTLVSRLLAILQDIETQELLLAEKRNKTATRIVNEDMRKLDILLILFLAGSVLLIYRIIIDMGRSNRYRKELLIAKEEAEEAGMAKQRFLANISHELRTPLQTIVGVSEQMHLQGNAKPAELEMVYHSSKHLLQIVNEVLDYSRIISGKFTFEQQPFNIRSVLGEVLEVMNVLAERKGLLLASEIDVNDDRTYIGDAFRLKQVLYNLLGNAIKYTNEGSVKLTVSYKDFAGRSMFRFSVKDTGTGISEEDIARIFQQFEQAKNNHAGADGAGLGLNIVQALVDGQKGTIQVFSREGEGTEFLVTLSYGYAKQTEAVLYKGNNTVVTYSGKVMLVDDDSFILQLCSGILDKYAIRHVAYSSPLEALAAGIDEHINIVFLDIRMPEIGGIELMKRLKEKSGNRTVRFVALTAQALPGEKAEILMQGFDDLLMKPFLEHELLDAITEDNNVVGEQPGLQDMSVLERMTGGDKKLTKQVLQSLVRETSEDIANITSAISNDDAALIAESLHRIAGRLGQVGAGTLSIRARKLEHTLRDSGVISGYTATLNELRSDVEIFITGIIQYVRG